MCADIAWREIYGIYRKVTKFIDIATRHIYYSYVIVVHLGDMQTKP